MALLLGNIYLTKNDNIIFIRRFIKNINIPKNMQNVRMCEYFYEALTNVYVKITFLFYKISNLLVVYDRSFLSRNCLHILIINYVRQTITHPWNISVTLNL